MEKSCRALVYNRTGGGERSGRGRRILFRGFVPPWDLTEQIGNTAFMTGGVETPLDSVLRKANGSGVKRIGYEVAGR